MLRILIVDDEFKSRELIKVLLQTYCNNIDIVGAAADVSEGLKITLSKNPDLILLDVELGVETGFDLLTQLSNIGFNVIFITAHSHYALKAIKFSAIDYLLKPINPEELKSAIDKAHARQEEVLIQKRVSVLINNLYNNNHNNSGQQKIGLPTSDGLVFVTIDDIIYCEAEGAYTTIYTEGGRKIVVSKNLKEYENLLEGNRFFRVHNSYLVNLNKVIKYVKGEGGSVIMSNKAAIDVSKRRKEAFLSAVGMH